jgi:diguanylate cyclase (GGDEF)-like protein
LFARYGGEEFIIYASDIDEDNILRMTERLRLSICNKKFEYNEVIFSSSASFGIARVEDYDLEKGIVYSDKALYTAKREGRNKTVFWDKIKQ